MKKIDILGTEVTLGGREELFFAAAELIDKGGVIATVNPAILNSAASDTELRAALRGALAIPDGVGTSIAAFMLGERTSRFPGVELGEALLEVRPVRLGIVGGREGVAEAALENLTLRHPNVIPALARDGFSHSEEEISEAISDSRTELVFLCLGSPKQELFAKWLSGRHKGVLFISLGGSADIYSGLKKRCPRALRALRLEWAYRMAREPRRLAGLADIPSFFAKIIKQGKFERKIGKKVPKGY